MPIPILTRILRKLNHHRTTEAYFIGYPKTGNTWLIFMVGRYMQLACNLSCQPLFDANWLGRCARSCLGPAIQFTHRPLTWKTQTSDLLSFDNVIRPFLRKKVVLLVRHPLDTLVSAWFQERYQVKNGFQGNLESFISDSVFGIEKLLRFYKIWEEYHAKVKEFHLIRYEDMRANPMDGFRSLLIFLGITPDEEILRAAVEYSSFENMRRIEASGRVPRYRSSGLRVFATGDRANTDSYHVRRGKVGGYKDYLSAVAISMYEELVDRNLGTWLAYRQTDPIDRR